MAPTLKPYQLEGIEWLRDRRRALLADEAGLGKSVQLLYSELAEPLLIVAPAMVLEAGTWDDEIAKWADGIDATQVSYSSIAQRGPKGTVPRDANGFPMTPPKPEYAGRWGSVILDEAHYIKGRKTSWSNAVLELDTPQLHLATGTPIPNWAHESFMVLRAVRPEESRSGKRFGSYWRWVNDWFDVSKNRFGARDVGDLRADRTWEQFREENWAGLSLRRLREDVLEDLPPLTTQTYRTPMSKEQRKVYNRLKDYFIAWLDSGTEISAWSEPGLLVKLAKLSTSLDSLDPASPPSGKTRMLTELLDARDRQTLVVAHFQSSIEACVKAAVRAGKKAMPVHGSIRSEERQKAIRAFQSGDIDVLCASIGTISEGVTLHQGGADTVIRVERSATPSKNEQVIRRLHRIGVTRPVFSIDLVTPNSYDEHLLGLLKAKTDQQMHALGEADFRSLV